jgi:hypothetical protein
LLYKDGERVYLRAVNKEHTSFIGKRITHINGQPVLDVINNFRPTMSSNNDVGFYGKVNGYMRHYSVWKDYSAVLTDSILLFTFEDSTGFSLHPISPKSLGLAAS